MSVSAAVLVGCTQGALLPDLTTSAIVSRDSSGDVSASSDAVDAACASSLRGRTFGVTDVTASPERRVSVGDTLRVPRLSAASSSTSSATAPRWRVRDSSLARVEGELVIPIAPGRTRLTALVSGRAVCVGLTTLFAGAALRAIAVDPMPTPLSVDGTSRLRATLRFTNGMSVAVTEAATWTALDPTVATVSSDAWITPRRDGVTRVVAAAGAFADTVTVQVSSVPFESLAARPADSFVESIGVNVHLSYLDRVYGSGFRTIIIPRLRELRVRHLRDGGTWLPNDDWMREIYGRWRETSDATGARFTVIVSPRRTATGPGSNYGDVSQVRDLADRIGVQNIDAWEGLNEHDVSGRADFPNEVRTLQQALYRFVKGDPELAARHQVLGPSMAFITAASRVGDLSAFMDDGVIHPYDGGQRPGANFPSHRDGVRAISGSRPLTVTEVGYHTASASTNPWHWAVSEAVQAKYTLRQFLELYNAGVHRSFAYEFIDEGTDASDMEQQFGLLRNDGSHKPAFDALRNLIALLDDRGGVPSAPRALRVRLSGDTAGVHKLVLEKADGRRYLILWQNGNSYDEQRRQDLVTAARNVSLTFDTSMRSAAVYIPLTGMEAVAVQQNIRVLTIAVPDHPIVIELRD